MTDDVGRSVEDVVAELENRVEELEAFATATEVRREEPEPGRDRESRSLGTIGETEVRIVAEGPKARWCVDVLSAKFETAFAAVKGQVEEVEDR